MFFNLIEQLPILLESNRSSKEACIKHYKKIQNNIEKQIDLLGIIPTIPYSTIEPLQENYSEDADLDVLDALAQPIFDALDAHFIDLDVNTPLWKTMLLQKMIFDQITPEILAEKACQKPAYYNQIQRSLQHPNLMDLFLDGGEPKDGNYSKALDIYYSIMNVSTKAKSGSKSSNNSGNIFHRLAIAVALEFAKPIYVFDSKHEIDPVTRYLHYEKAYIDGELDPCFPTLSIWDLRMVVNNDASDDEIFWCRRMLRNYRPDHILDRSYHWRYCMVVKTEVRYKVPDWKHFPKTYKQLISGGGKCGPRAWFGRYACKSFGIPTWGVRQPGHAAMSHWMPPDNMNNDWVICLGGPNWKKSFWENRKGTHFSWEVCARRHPNEFECIKWMKCFARMAKEKCIENRKPAGLKDLWTQLSWLKMRQIVRNANAIKTYDTKSDMLDEVVWTCMEQVKNMTIDKSEAKYLNNGNIIIPASSNDLDVPKQNVIVMKSFHEDGGDQVHLRQGGTLKYSLYMPKEVERRKNYTFKFRLSCRIVTVHAEHHRLSLQIKDESAMEKVHHIDVPYSEGEWSTTDPIEISLFEGKKSELCFSFQSEGALGLTIKDFKLERIN